MSTTLPPEVEDELRAMRGRECPCGCEPGIHERLRTAALIGLSAGRVQGLEEAAKVADSKSIGPWNYDEQGPEAIAQSIRKLATEDKPEVGER